MAAKTPRIFSLLTVMAMTPACLWGPKGDGDWLAWQGAYDVAGAWNLSGPFVGGRGVGDAVEEFIVEEMVAAVGVPSALHDEASVLVAGLVAGKIKTAVDANLPADLQTGSALMQALSVSLADVEVTGALELAEGVLPGSLVGSETFATVAYDHQGTRVALSAGDLLGDPALEIIAEWKGKQSAAAALTIEPHAVTIQYDALVRSVALQVMSAANLDALGADLAARVDCTTIVSQLLEGQTTYTFDFEAVTYSLTDSELAGLCADVKTKVEGRLLGLFALDTPVEIGGGVLLVDSDGDLLADSLLSDSDFQGHIAIVPKPIAPKVFVDFSAARK